MVAGIESQNQASLHLHQSLGFVVTAQMPQVGTKFGRWLDLTFMQLQLDERTEPDAIDESVTYPCLLIAAGIGLVVQNTLMVRITQTSSTILIAMLLNSLVGIVLFVSILWFKQGMAGFGELVSSVRWWTLIPGLLGSFLSSPVSADIRMWERRQLLQYWSPAS